MPNIKVFNQSQPAARTLHLAEVPQEAPSLWARSLTTGLILTAALLAPIAGAQDVEALAATATSGTDSVKTVVLAIAGVALTIGLVIWGVRHMKPKN